MHGICTYDAIIHAFIKQNWPIRTIEYKSKSLSRSDAQHYIYERYNPHELLHN